MGRSFGYYNALQSLPFIWTYDSSKLKNQLYLVGMLIHPVIISKALSLFLSKIAPGMPQITYSDQ